MTVLTTLDILYLVLAFFTSIIWVLLTIVLIRLIKILWVVVEITDYYKVIKSYISMYAKIPEMIKEKVFEIIKKNKQ